MTCFEIDGGFICKSETVTVRTVQVGVRWCFVCRKRVEFTDTLKADAQPSYYDPFWVRKCQSGHADGDLFPGWYREYA